MVVVENARTEEYRSLLKGYKENNICPFCDLEHEVIHRNQYWYSMHNANPLPHAKTHYMVIPVRHVESVLELTQEEWVSLKEILSDLEEIYKEPKSYYWRDGDKYLTGGTIQHLHIQGVIPDGGRVAVLFGPLTK